MYELPSIEYESDLVSKIFELERLRSQLGVGTTPSEVLVQLHQLFQVLTSVVSARIEGNRTTVFEAASTLDDQLTLTDPSDQIKEIANIQEAMRFIDSLDDEAPLTHLLVRGLHEIAVSGLIREGDTTPGSYRAVDVEILRAAHRPPRHALVQASMDDFIEFANRPMIPRSQLIHVAMSHHRFLWIHPFRNGNGRVARLLSYFMLRRHHFVSPVGMRTVNPAAVFGSDRTQYLDALARADDLGNDGTLAWCEFFVGGMADDLERLVRLQDFDFVSTQLMQPVYDRFRRAGMISRREQDALLRVLDKQVVMAGDLDDIFLGSPSVRSQQIRGLIDRGLISPISPAARKYRLSLTSPGLTPFVIRQLDEIGFLPTLLKDDRAD